MNLDELKKLAEEGVPEAQYNLSLIYSLGKEVPKDHQVAIKWYQLAAEQGFARAHNDLGFMYGNGKGVPQDFIRAHMWWNLAASSGNKKAISGRDAVAKDMPPADISAAQKLARECVRKNYKGC